MNDETEPAQRAFALYAGNDVIRQLHPLERPAQAELAGVDHERLVLRGHDLFREIVRRVAEVDRRYAVVVKDPERVTKPKVDTRRLHQARVPWLDSDPPVFDQPQDRPVR